MIETLHNIDQDVFLFLNGLNHHIVDPMMKSFSGQYVWTLMYVAIAFVICWRYGWRRGLALVAIIAVAIGCSDMLCSQVLRPIVGRLRPAHVDNPISVIVHIVDGYRGGSYGFPSCHAANTFTLAMATSALLRSRPYAAFIFLWAVLQCYSRIYLGVHYPGDIIVGALIGSLMGFLGYRACAYFLTKSADYFAANPADSPDKPQPSKPEDIHERDLIVWPVYAAAAVIIITIIILPWL